MKKTILLTLIIGLCSVFISLPTHAAPEWSVASSNTGLGSNISPDFQFQMAPNDTPYIAYRTPDKTQIIVQSYNGVSWDMVGTPISTPTDMSSLPERIFTYRLKIDQNNVPYIAYNVDVADTPGINVMKLSGDSWTQVGDTISVQYFANNFQSRDMFDLTIAPDGQIYVAAYTEQEDPDNQDPDTAVTLSVIKSLLYNTTTSTWESFAPDLTIAPNYFDSSNMSIIVDSNQTLYTSMVHANELWLYKYTNSSWERIPATRTPNVIAYASPLVLDSQNRLYIAYTYQTSGQPRSQIEVYDGTALNPLDMPHGENNLLSLAASPLVGIGPDDAVYYARKQGHTEYLVDVNTSEFGWLRLQSYIPETGSSSWNYVGESMAPTVAFDSAGDLYVALYTATAADSAVDSSLRRIYLFKSHDAGYGNPDLALSETSIPEDTRGSDPNTIDPYYQGPTLSVTGFDTYNQLMFWPVDGEGSDDNYKFYIEPFSGQITFVYPPDYEQPIDSDNDNVYKIRVRVTDMFHSYERALTITVTDATETTSTNNPPTDLTPNTASAPENTSTSTVVWTPTVTDPDANETFTYSLISGTGSDDNGDFTINTSTGGLSFVASPNYESPADADQNNAYKVLVQVSDGEATYSESITINVTNVNEAPTDLSPNSVSIDENIATTSAVWTPSVTDPDASNTFSYSMVSGAGSDDNARFSIDGATGELRFIVSPDYENPNDANADNDYQVRVQVSDGTSTYDEAITITVNDTSETLYATINNAEDAGLIRLAAPNATAFTCSDVSKESDNSKQDQPYDYPVGFIDFCFTTADANNQVTLVFVTDKDAGDVILRKYNPTTGAYADVAGAVLTNTTLDGAHAVQAVYTITDNGDLDLDTATGSIQDPVGLAAAVSTNGGTTTNGGTSGGNSNSDASDGSADANLASTGTNIALFAVGSVVLFGLGVLAIRKLRSA